MAESNTPQQLYQPTHWLNLVTPLDEINMNKIEQGVYKLSVNLKNLLTDLNITNANIENLEATTAKITDLTSLNATIENLKVESATIKELNALKGNFDTLKANVISVEQLEAVNGKFQELEVGKATIEQLKAISAQIGSLEANTVKTEEMVAAHAFIGELEAKKATIEELHAQKAEIEELIAEKATIEQLEAVNAIIKNLEVETAKIKDLEAETATIKNLVADKVSIGDFTAITGRVEVLETGKVSTVELNAELAKINEVIAGKVSTEELKAVNAEITNLKADKIGVTELNAEIAKVEKLIANKVEVGELEAAVARIGQLEVDTLKTGDLDAVNATIKNLKADKLNVSDFNAEKADIEELIAKKANVSDLTAMNATIEDLKADKIGVKELEAEIAKVNELIAGKVSTEELKAVNAEITNLKADKIGVTELNAEIAKVKELIADKVNVSELTAINADIKNLKADKIGATELNAEIAKVEKLIAGKVEAEELEVAVARIEELETGTLKTGDLEAVNATIEKLKVDKLNVKDFNANKAEIIELIAKKATIEQLVATNGKIETLESTMITTEVLNAELAKINEVVAGKVDTAQLTAINATIKDLSVDVGKINTLLSGNITSENIQTGGITSDRLTIANGFIKDLMVDSVSASKIKTGILDTELVTILSKSGNLSIADNTIQIKDKNEKVRVQIGKDAKDDYSMSVWDADENLMFDARGLTSDAIKDSIIRDDMVAENAGISGSKLDINTVVDEINKDGTKVIKGTKIQLDDQNQSLSVSFTQLLNKTSENTEHITSLNTRVTVQQGEIKTAIENTTIEKDGEKLLLKDEYSKTVQTIDEMNQTLGSHDSTINEHTGKIEEVNTNTSVIKQDLEGITTRVESSETKIETVENKIDNLNIGVINIIINSNFKKLLDYNPGWDISLNGNKRPVNWSLYNGTVESSEIGYHAQVNTTKFNVPVIAFINKNGEYGLPSRWLGSSCPIAVNKYKMKSNCEYTISLDLYAEQVGLQIRTGLYYKKIGEDVSKFHSGLKKFNIVEEEVQKWVRKSFTFKILEDIDVNAVTNLYIYGYDGDNNISYVKNIQLEEGNIATGWKESPFDLEEELVDVKNIITEHTTKLGEISSFVDSMNSTTSSIDGTVTGIINRMDKAEQKITDGSITQAVENKVSSLQKKTDNIANGNRVCDLGFKINYSTFTATANGRAYIHGYDEITNDPLDKDGKIIYSSDEYTIPSGTVTPAIDKLNQAIYVYYSILDNKNYMAYYDKINNKWKSKLVSTGSFADFNWIEDKHIVLAEFSMATSTRFNYFDVYKEPKAPSVVCSNDESYIVSTYSTKAEVTQTSKDIITKFEEAGGYNILFNGKAIKTTDFWKSQSSLPINRFTDEPNFDTGFLGKFPGGIYGEDYKLKNDTTYTYEAYINSSEIFVGTISTPLHFWCCLEKGEPISQVQSNTIEYHQKIEEANKWTKLYVKFKTKKTGDVWFRPFIYTGNSLACNFKVTEISLTEGSLEKPWSPNPSEVYDGIIKQNKDGIEVSASNVNSITRMSADGFKLLKGEEEVFKVENDGTLNIKGKIIAEPTKGIHSNVNLCIGKNFSGQAISNPNFLNDGIKKIYAGNYTEQQYVSGEDRYIQVDLGDIYTIAESRLYFYAFDTRCYFYKIIYSTDGVIWNYAIGNDGENGWAISRKSDTTTKDTATNFPTINLFQPTISARYVRLLHKGNTINVSIHLYEWELFSATQTEIDASGIRTGKITATNNKTKIDLDSGSMLIGRDTDTNYLKYDGTVLDIKATSMTLGGTSVATTTIVNETKNELNDLINSNKDELQNQQVLNSIITINNNKDTLWGFDNNLSSSSGDNPTICNAKIINKGVFGGCVVIEDKRKNLLKNQKFGDHYFEVGHFFTDIDSIKSTNDEVIYKFVNKTALAQKYYGNYVDFRNEENIAYTLSGEVFVSSDYDVTGAIKVHTEGATKNFSFTYDQNNKGTWQSFKQTIINPGTRALLLLYPSTSTQPTGTIGKGYILFKNISFTENAYASAYTRDEEDYNELAYDKTCGDNFSLMSYKKSLLEEEFSQHTLTKDGNTFKYYKNGTLTTEYENKWKLLKVKGIKSPGNEGLNVDKYINIVEQINVDDPLRYPYAWNNTKVGLVARTFIYSSINQTIYHRYGLDNWGIVYFNGKPVLERGSVSGKANNDIRYDLVKGWNIVEVMCVDADGGGGISPFEYHSSGQNLFYGLINYYNISIGNISGSNGTELVPEGYPNFARTEFIPIVRGGANVTCKITKSTDPKYSIEKVIRYNSQKEFIDITTLNKKNVETFNITTTEQTKFIRFVFVSTDSEFSKSDFERNFTFTAEEENTFFSTHRFSDKTNNPSVLYMTSEIPIEFAENKVHFNQRANCMVDEMAILDKALTQKEVNAYVKGKKQFIDPNPIVDTPAPDNITFNFS